MPDGVAGLAARRLVDQFEDLFQPLDLALGLAMMLFERRAQLVGLGGLRHFRQRLQNLLFGEINVLERIEEQVVEVFVFGSHGALHCEIRNIPVCQRHLMANVPVISKGKSSRSALYGRCRSLACPQAFHRPVTSGKL
jgi:hypothetical protein